MKTLVSKRRIAAVLLAVVMLFALSACGANNATTPADNSNQQSETTPADNTAPANEPDKEPEKEPEQEPEKEEPEPQPADITVTDMSGDEVTIKLPVKSIINLWPAGTSSFFVMGAGDLISGVANNGPGAMNSWTKFFYPGCADIPVLSGTAPTIEEVIALNPDLVIIHPTTAKDGMAQTIRESGIPAININFTNYETMTKAYTMLTQILDDEYASKLNTWCAEVGELIAKNQELTKDLTEADRPVVYYISGQNDQLTTTMASNSIVQDWVELCGGQYATAIIELNGSSTFGTEITPEAVFELDPDVIIVGGVNQHILMKALQETDGWKDLKAVKDGRVYNNPYGCFNWDRFGLESRLQIEYGLMCIQPEIAKANGIDRDYMINRVIDFYSFYNGKQMTAEEAGYMLDGLQPDGTPQIPAN